MVTKKKILSLFALAASTSMIFLDATILPVALPTIQRELNVTGTELQWMINSYLLAMASLALAGGRIADLFGHRRLFCTGMLIFACASAIGGLAFRGWWLIVSRALQGVGGAFMGPAALSLVIETFPLRQRGMAMGTLVGFSSLFLTLGPFLGGLFTEMLSWRFVFWVNLPISLIGVLLALLYIPRSKKIEESFDFLGFLTLSIALLSLIYAIMQGYALGWANYKILGAFALFIISALFLPFSEKLAKDPFFDRKLFRIPLFLAGSAIIVCTQFLLMITVYWAIYFQTTLDFSPLQAGSITLFSTLPIMIFAPTSGHIFDRIGPKWPVVIGLSLITSSMIWFFFFLDKGSLPLLIPALLGFGCGIPLIMTPNSTATLASVPDSKRGAASGVYNTMRYIGATLGVAVLGATINGFRHVRLREILHKNPATSHLNAENFLGLESGRPSSLAHFKELSITQKTFVKESLQKADFFSYSAGALVSIIVALIALTIALIFLGRYCANKAGDELRPPEEF